MKTDTNGNYLTSDPKSTVSIMCINICDNENFLFIHIFVCRLFKSMKLQVVSTPALLLFLILIALLTLKAQREM